MTNERAIISALQKGVVAAVQQSNEPTLPVQYLMKKFDIPQSQKWLEVVWLPNTPIPMLADGANHRGILRLVLHWSNDGGDIYRPVELMASITRYFTSGRLLSGVQIYGSVSPTGMVEDGDDVLFPVSIQYQSYQGA